ncbi:MAG: hypothetical protein ACM3ML_09210 [Micromonosporaceae bacterium]
MELITVRIDGSAILGESMPVEARALVPSGDHSQAAYRAFDEAAEPKLTLFDVPGDCMPTEGLVAALTRKGRHPLWMRLGLRDGDPGSLLASLAIAAQRFGAANVTQDTLALMRSRPGPVYGWPPLFARLGAELRERLAERGALVLENVQHTWTHSAAFTLLSTHLLPVLADTAPTALIASGSPPRGVPAWWVRRSGDDLCPPLTALRRVVDECAPHLSRRAHDRVAALATARPTVLAAIRAARVITGPGELASALERAHGEDELLTRLAGILLADPGHDGRRSLGLAVRVEYTHPAMTPAVTGSSRLPQGPWLQPLEGGRSRVRACWRDPLRRALGPRAMPSREALHAAADWLLQADTGDEAVRIYLGLGDYECAARAIATRAETLIYLGQWQTLEGWLARLPSATLAAFPDLSYARAGNGGGLRRLDHGAAPLRRGGSAVRGAQ